MVAGVCDDASQPAAWMMMAELQMSACMHGRYRLNNMLAEINLVSVSFATANSRMHGDPIWKSSWECQQRMPRGSGRCRFIPAQRLPSWCCLLAGASTGLVFDQAEVTRNLLPRPVALAGRREVVLQVGKVEQHFQRRGRGGLPAIAAQGGSVGHTTHHVRGASRVAL